MNGGAKCTGNKSVCNSKEDCIWIPSKGCRLEDNVPLATLAKLRKSSATSSRSRSSSPKPRRASSGCNGTKKASCDAKKDCIWVPSKGCRVEDNLPLAILAKVKKMKESKSRSSSPTRRASPAGCNGSKKASCDAKEDCVWVPSKGCRVEDNVPLAILAKIAAKAKAKKVSAQATAAVKATKLGPKKAKKPSKKAVKKGGNNEYEEDE